MVSKVHIQHQVVPHGIKGLEARGVLGLVELNDDITQLGLQFQELFEGTMDGRT